MGRARPASSCATRRALTRPTPPRPADAPKGYAGASLAALDKLARRKGYRLVLCEETGINAFFLRNDVATGIPTLTSEAAWRPLLNQHAPLGVSRKELDIM